MKTHKEIKKGLEYCGTRSYCSDECPYYSGERCEIATDALALIKQLEAQVPKWISMEDEQPKLHRADYIVRYVFPQGHMSFCGVMRWNTCGENGYVEGPHFDNEGYLGMHVTHWMPLPTPPEAPKMTPAPE